MIRKRFTIAFAPPAVVAAERARAAVAVGVRTGLVTNAGDGSDYGTLTPDGQALIAEQQATARRSDLEIGAWLVGGTLLGAWVGATYFPIPATGPFGIPALVHGAWGGALAGGFLGFVLALVGGFWVAMTFGGAQM